MEWRKEEFDGVWAEQDVHLAKSVGCQQDLTPLHLAPSCWFSTVLDDLTVEQILSLTD